WRLRVEHQSGAFARTGGKDHDACANLAFFARLRVHVRDPRRTSLVVREDLARHGVGDDREVTGFERRWQQHALRGEIGSRRASAAALSAVVTLCTTAVRTRQNRQTRRYDRYPDFIRPLLDQEFVTTWFGRREEDAIWFVEDAFLTAEESDESVDAVVVRFDFVVRNGPVVALAVEGLATKVVWSEAQRYTTPVVCTSAQHSGPPPVPFGTLGYGVGFALDLPSANTAIEFAKGFFGGAATTSRRLVVPGEHGTVAGRIPVGAGFEK